MGDKCGAHTFPEIDCRNRSAVVEHEATTSKINEEQLFYCQPARHPDRRGSRPYSQRLCQRGDEQAADGIRGRVPT